MAGIYPENPILNQQVIVGSKTMQWNGAVWKVLGGSGVGGGGGSSIVISQSDPFPNPASVPEGTEVTVRETFKTYKLINGAWVEDGNVGDEVDVTAASYLTVAQAQASDLSVGQRLVLTDRDDAPAIVRGAGLTPDGYSVLSASDGLSIEILPHGTEINVKHFGAVGDGVTDDTPAIQAAIDYTRRVIERKSGYTVDALVGTMLFPDGTYAVTELYAYDAYGIILRGVGVVASRILWRGTNVSGGPLNFIDCNGPILERVTVYIDPAYPCGHAVSIEQDSARVNNNPSNFAIENAEIVGNDVMYQGVRVTYTGDDLTNDFNYFRRVTIRGYTNFGVWLNGFQSHLNYFEHCSISGLNLAEDTDNPQGQYGVYSQPQPSGISASFVVDGGSIAGHSKADFFIGGTNQGTVIRNISNENSVRLVEGATGSFSQMLTLENVRWDSKNLHADGRYMTFPAGVNLNVRNSSVNTSNSGAVPKIHVGGNKGNFVRVENSRFNTYVNSNLNSQNTPCFENTSSFASSDDIEFKQCSFVNSGSNTMRGYLTVSGEKPADFTIDSYFGDVTHHINTSGAGRLIGINPLYAGQRITLRFQTPTTVVHSAAGAGSAGIFLKGGVDYTPANVPDGIILEYDITFGKWFQI